MLQVLTWMVRLPTVVILTGVEAFRKTVQEFQQLFDQRLGTVVGAPGASDEKSRSLVSDDTVNCQAATDCKPEIKAKEDRTMLDQELGGDDLKYVSYSILFTKRDYEATLEEQKEFLVNYSTDGASFASLKMMEFAGRHFRRPEDWISTTPIYPPGIDRDETKLTVANIPPEDRKYLRFVYNVEHRLPRQARDYDRDKVRALQGIREDLGDISEKIGS